MIVVKAELHSAITGEVTELGRLIVWNDGTSNDPTRGDYHARVARKGASVLDALRRDKFTREGRVEAYPRLAYPVWRLILRALRSCYPEER